LLNKADLGDQRGTADALGALSVSAVTGEGLREALHRIADLIDEAERLAPERRGFVLHRPLGPSFRIVREGPAWRVEGVAAERAVGFADLTLPEAAELAALRLSRLGVDDALSAAGAMVGDEVRIGEISFEFLPDIDSEE
jgi:GTP-binding protein